jgi:Fe-S cluster assembly protein SufD
MSVAVIKTKAEQTIAQSFEAVATRLPGKGWAGQARAAAIAEFARTGLPHRRVEAWKYTDLRALMKEAFPPAVAGAAAIDPEAIDRALGPELADLSATRLVFVNGAFVEPRVTGVVLPGCRFDPLARAIGEAEFAWLEPHLATEAGTSADALLALNTAFATDGALLRVEPGAKPALPIHLVFLSDAVEPASVTTRNLIEVGRGAHCVIVESHVGAGDQPRQSNAVTEIHVGDGAHVQHIKYTREGLQASHVSTWLARLGRDVVYRAFHLTAGSGLVRNQARVTFAGEGSRLDFSGAFLAHGGEHIDTALLIDHVAGHCESRELFKGVLDGRSRGVFQGKVIVRPGAQKTDGKQMAQALMLSPDAEFDSKPELEIYADDVACGHGSTAAEIDPDLVFYCRARGMPEATARALLIEAFVGEAIEKVEHEGVREAFFGLAKGWLAAAAPTGA